jgi:hypothetical protein
MPAVAAPVPIPPPQQQKLSLLEAVAAASQAFGDLTKDSKNDYLKSSYLALPGLLKAIKPALLEHGVVIYSQATKTGEVWVVRTTLAFVDGSEELCSDFPIPDVSNLQRIGAAFTYGVRYNLFALLAISPDADDDGNGAAAGGPAGGAAVAALPGLPGYPQAMPQQVAYQQPMPPGMPQAPYQQPMPQHMPQAMVANAVQPYPVLQ